VRIFSSFFDSGNNSRRMAGAPLLPLAALRELGYEPPHPKRAGQPFSPWAGCAHREDEAFKSWGWLRRSGAARRRNPPDDAFD